jgi:hypothetical protein
MAQKRKQNGKNQSGKLTKQDLSERAITKRVMMLGEYIGRQYILFIPPNQAIAPIRLLAGAEHVQAHLSLLDTFVNCLYRLKG